MVSTSEPTQPGPAPAGAAPPRPVASYRTNLVTTVLAVWFTLGLFVDAWAHSNLARLETFFTPWHAVFYSGFAATAAWIAWTIRPALRRGWPEWRAMPAGYGPAAVAIVGFAISGAGDGTWHTVFGIEQDIDILFSPTHLGLITTMFVIVTTPLRAMWADGSLQGASGEREERSEAESRSVSERRPGEREERSEAESRSVSERRPGLLRLLPAVLSTAFATTLVLLFLQYANAIAFDSGSIVVALSNLEEGFTSNLVSSMAVTTAVLITPLLTLARRWRVPFGTATILHGAVGALSGAFTAFENADMIIAFVVAGVCVDLLALWLRPTPARLLRFRAFAALAPIVTWSIFFVAAAVLSPPLSPVTDFRRDGATVLPEAVVELYTGAPVLQGLLGLLIAILLLPDRRSARA